MNCLISGWKRHLEEQRSTSAAEQERARCGEQWLHDQPDAEQQHVVLGGLQRECRRSTVRQRTAADQGGSQPVYVTGDVGVGCHQSADQRRRSSASQNGPSGLRQSSFVPAWRVWNDDDAVGSSVATCCRWRPSVDGTDGVSLFTRPSEQAPPTRSFAVTYLHSWSITDLTCSVNAPVTAQMLCMPPYVWSVAYDILFMAIWCILQPMILHLNSHFPGLELCPGQSPGSDFTADKFRHLLETFLLAGSIMSPLWIYWS